ncbi:Alcohol acetyltransferase [Clarireedia jacksonii]
MYTLDQYRGTSIACRYSIPPRLAGPESKPHLMRVMEAAIIDVVLKHPTLHVGIIDAESKKPRWVQLERLNLHEHVTWQFLDASMSFDKMSQELTVTEVDGTFSDLERRPGWRIVFMYQESTNLLEINFTWNHPHADGISGKIFQTDICQSLNAQMQKDHNGQENTISRVIELPKTSNLPPAIEEVCKLPVDPLFVARMAWEEFGPASLVWTRPSLARWAPFQISPYKTQFRAFTMESDAFGKVLVACRRHKTTLTGLLHGLALVSLSSLISEEVQPAFESGTTVDMRRFMSTNPPSYPSFQPEKTMGNYVTILSHGFDSTIVSGLRSKIIPKGSTDEGHLLPDELLQLVWSVGAKVRRDIKRKIERGLKNDPVGAMKFVGDWRKQMINTAKRPRQFSWWVTGVGVMDGRPSAEQCSSPEDSWVVHRAQFALSAESTAAAMMISPMTAAGGQLCIGVSWQDCVCDRLIGERILADLKRWLDQIALQIQP